MPQTQLLFDFEEGMDPLKLRMLEALRPACLHTPRLWNHYRRPTCHCAENVRSALKAVDHFQQKLDGCNPTVEMLAMQARCSERSMQRWLRLADDTGYLTVTTRGHATSCYSINWLRIWNETEEADEQPLSHRAAMPVGAI